MPPVALTMIIDRTSFISPNHSSRRGRDIDMLVLHSTVGSAAASLSWLRSAHSKVSIHYLITKTGTIYQLVPDHLSAWHAGKSRWRNRSATDIALGSIGIELENKNTGIDPYPLAQTTALLELSRSLVVKYAILSDMVVRHLDIAVPVGRKSDPAGFPWLHFMSSLYVPQPTAYRVRVDTQIGATVREHASARSERLMSIAAGTLIHGKPVSGETIMLPGFGTSNQWLQLSNGGYVWFPLVEIIPQA